MSNPNSLTGELILRKAWSDTDQALKMVPASTTTFAIELDAADGDNVRIIPNDVNSKTSVTTGSGTVVAAFNVVGIKSVALYTNTTTNITGPALLTLELSPSDTDNIWIASSITITPSATAGTVAMSTAASITARRARVRTASANADGAYDIYVVGQAV